MKTLSSSYILHHSLVNLTVPICRPYVLDLLLGTGARLNSMRYNTVLDSI